MELLERCVPTICVKDLKAESIKQSTPSDRTLYPLKVQKRSRRMYVVVVFEEVLHLGAIYP